MKDIVTMMIGIGVLAVIYMLISGNLFDSGTEVMNQTVINGRIIP